MKAIDRLIGSFRGSGSWHDSLGQSQTYAIEQTNLIVPGGFELTFKHDFEDGSVVNATFTMIELVRGIFRLEMAGTVVGNGYVLDDYCHYHLKVGDAFVEASYRLGDSELRVFGSSTKNADGNYIAWRETLNSVAS